MNRCILSVTGCFIAGWLVVGCTTAATAQVEIKAPVITPPASATEPQPEEPATPTVRLAVRCPNGWSAARDDSLTSLTLRHDHSSAVIRVSLWPLAEQTPSEKMMATWSDLSDQADEDSNLHPGQPFEQNVEGAKVIVMLSVRTTAEGRQHTLLHAAYRSNHEDYGIFLDGHWTASMNGLMYSLIGQIARSIRVTTSEP
jgi:hypothetical protein